jgi:hypothetical protein
MNERTKLTYGEMKGFRMIVGSPTVNTKAGVVNGLAYTCLQNINTRGAETQEFPSKPCPAGIMAIHHFPALVVHPSISQFLVQCSTAIEQPF